MFNRRVSIYYRLLAAACLLFVLATACAASSNTGSSKGLHVLAVESFLADIAQNVAGDRVKVDTLIPLGMDPHGFEPAPSDVAKVSNSSVIIINGAGLETFLQRLLNNAGGQHQVIDASQGLKSRVPSAQEALDPAEMQSGDPHFWLDPNNVIHYVQNIQTGLSKADPDGASFYATNASAYIQKLKELDSWVSAEVAQISPEQRLLVTNHETFGYYADRYGFRIVGTIIPSTNPDASPSARDLATLVERIKATGVPAVFLEKGSNPQLAEQIASETNIKVITDLWTHSISPQNGPAPTYIDMIRFDTSTIVSALKK